MAKNTFYAIAQQVTVSRWSYEKEGLTKNQAKLDTTRLGGTVRIRFERCKENILARFNADAMPIIMREDGTIATNGIQYTMEKSYENIRMGAERWIKGVTPEKRKALNNSEVYHVNLIDLMDIQERLFELTEIVEELDETYFSVSYENGDIKLDKRDKHMFKTNVMRVIACAELGLTEESAIAKWHSTHKTEEEIAKIKSERQKRIANEAAEAAAKKTETSEGE